MADNKTASNRRRLVSEGEDDPTARVTDEGHPSDTWHDYLGQMQTRQRSSHFDKQRNDRKTPKTVDKLNQDALADGDRPLPGIRGINDQQDEAQQYFYEVAGRLPARQESAEPSPDAHQANRNSTVADEEQQNLNELASQPPIEEEDPTGQWRRQSHLEDPREREVEGPEMDPLFNLYATQLYILCHLIFFSILGVLARLGMQRITFYPGAPVTFSNIWANFAGSLVMGFLTEDQKLFRQEWGTESATNFAEKSKGGPRGSPSIRANHVKRKKTIPLYIGLTVGFCGSFTSFSTFQRDIFLALANALPATLSHPTDVGTSPSTTVRRNGGYSFEALIAVIILTVTACLGALKMGGHLAILADRYIPSLPFRLIRNIIDPLVVFLGAGCWVGAIVMSALPPDRIGGPVYQGQVETWRGQALFALVLAPVGCLLRFYLSLKLNGLVPWFPLGTFVANLFGTAVLGMTYDLQRAPLMIGNGRSVGGGVNGCQILQGVEDGFCGALTTVSTWVVELTSLKRRHAYLYGATSVLGGLGFLVAIMGSVLWTIGYSTPSCVLETS